VSSELKTGDFDLSMSLLVLSAREVIEEVQSSPLDPVSFELLPLLGLFLDEQLGEADLPGETQDPSFLEGGGVRVTNLLEMFGLLGAE